MKQTIYYNEVICTGYWQACNLGTHSEYLPATINHSNAFFGHGLQDDNGDWIVYRALESAQEHARFLACS